MENIALTISISAYNVEDSIGTTLNSLVVPKEYENKIEVIVVNDGSKDCTAEVANKFCEEHSSYIRLINKENGGYGSTINTSFKIAQGKYYKQLDAGDTYNTKALVQFIDYLDNCQSDIVITPYEKYFVNTSQIKLEDAHPGIGGESCEISNIDLGEDILMHEMAFRKDLMRDKDFAITERCFYTDNEYTFLPLMEAHTISRFNLPIYRYYLGVEGQSVSVQGMRKHYEDTRKVAFKLYDLYIKNLDKLKSKGTLKFLMQKKICKISDILYSSYMLQKNNSTKKELISIDKEIKINYPIIYELINSIKKIRLLHITRFSAYGLQCLGVETKIKKN